MQAKIKLNPTLRESRNAHLASFGPGDFSPPDTDDTQERVAEALFEERSQDLEHLSDACGDVLSFREGYRNHPNAIELLSLIRDGTDNALLGSLLRNAVMDALFAECELAAEDKENWP